MNDSTPAPQAPELDLEALVFGPTALSAELERSRLAWEEVRRAGEPLDELAAARLEPCPFAGAGLEAGEERTRILLALGSHDEDAPLAAPVTLPEPVLWEVAA